MRFKTLAMFFNGTEMRCKSISKSFQNIVNALSNIDNAFNETATGRLESFIAPLLFKLLRNLYNELLATLARTYRFEFEQKQQIHGVFL